MKMSVVANGGRVTIVSMVRCITTFYIYHTRRHNSVYLNTRIIPVSVYTGHSLYIRNHRINKYLKYNTDNTQNNTVPPLKDTAYDHPYLFNTCTAAMNRMNNTLP